MRWLIENILLEREEETEKLRYKGEGLLDYDCGSVFRITDTGREQLKEIWEEQRQQLVQTQTAEEKQGRGSPTPLR